MNTEQSRTLVIRAWETFAIRDEDRIASFFAPDAHWRAPKRNATALALDYTDHLIGAQSIARFIARDMHQLFHDLNVEIRGVYAEGSTVIVEERMTATLPNGVPYDNAYVFVFECRDGVITEVREYMDTKGGYEQVFSRGDPLA